MHHRVRMPVRQDVEQREGGEGEREEAEEKENGAAFDKDEG